MPDTNALPELHTERLTLRPFKLDDASDVQRLAGNPDVALMTTNIPYPYEDGMAEAWIATHRDAFARDEAVVLAITLRSDGTLVGGVGLTLDEDEPSAELGYWVGKPYWNKGYCTEAARAVLQYGFERWPLERIHACHLARNTASGRVMQKLGMTYHSRLPKRAGRQREMEDLIRYEILRTNFQPNSSPT